jgi:RNA polymerase sigma-70 factor (ECF subfamily)
MGNFDNLCDPDNDLLNQAAEGNEKAFEELIKKYEKAVFSTIYRYTGNKEDIEDLAQEIFFKIWQKANSFKGRSKFSTWLYRIVVNHCLNYKAKTKHHLQHESLDEMSARGKTPESLKVYSAYDGNCHIEMIQRAINELPKNQRLAFILAQLEDKSHAEIAEIMNLSVSSVHSLIFRARDSLKKKLSAIL